MHPNETKDNKNEKREKIDEEKSNQEQQGGRCHRGRLVLYTKSDIVYSSLIQILRKLIGSLASP